MPGLRFCCACASLLLALALGPPAASALVTPGAAIDGPSTAIRELGGVAMSADGSGGVVYRKDDDGRAHIFAAQYLNGAWQRPQRVDTGPDQRFESSWPAIAAGDEGRLVVVWVQEFGPSDRMFSATLQPGSRRFEAPVPLDLNVGDGSLGTWPAVSMAPGGQAYVVYRVITDPQPATAPPGTVLGEYRIARLTGQLWSGFGAPVNRNPAAPQSRPSALNRPQIGIDQLGDGVVAFEELDDELVPRIYAKRVFPGSIGLPLQVSPSDLGAGVVRAGADAFRLAVGRFGEAAVAWRQLAPQGAGASFTRPRVLVAQTPDVFSPEAARFGSARPFDGGGADGPATGLGGIAVAVSGSSVTAAFGSADAALATDGSEASVEAAVRLDSGAGAGPPDPVVALGSSGAAAFAWKQNAGARGAVAVRERRGDGVSSDRTVSGPRGGQVDDLQLAGSGLGDALAAFTQGSGAGRQVVAAAVDAPPDVFLAQAPNGWVSSRTVDLAWDVAAHAIGGVRYDVVVDDDTVVSGLSGTSYRLSTRGQEDGRRTITIVATDDAGQETTSVPTELRLDRRPPLVVLRVRGRGVRVLLRDGTGASGVQADATRVSFGDGARRARGATVGHRYRRAGRFRVTVTARDKVGNTRVVRRIVRVR